MLFLQATQAAWGCPEAWPWDVRWQDHRAAQPRGCQGLAWEGATEPAPGPQPGEGKWPSEGLRLPGSSTSHVSTVGGPARISACRLQTAHLRPESRVQLPSPYPFWPLNFGFTGKAGVAIERRGAVSSLSVRSGAAEHLLSRSLSPFAGSPPTPWAAD
jgi:hypothetical protein